MNDLQRKILAARESADELYHEICHLDRAELEDLELTILGALNELNTAVEIIEEMIDEENPDE